MTFLLISWLHVWFTPNLLNYCHMKCPHTQFWSGISFHPTTNEQRATINIPMLHHRPLLLKEISNAEASHSRTPMNWSRSLVKHPFVTSPIKSFPRIALLFLHSVPTLSHMFSVHLNHREMYPKHLEGTPCSQELETNQWGGIGNPPVKGNYQFILIHWKL